MPVKPGLYRNKGLAKSQLREPLRRDFLSTSEQCARSAARSGVNCEHELDNSKENHDAR